MLHNDYYRKGSVEKENLWSWFSRGLALRQTDWRQTASRKVTLTLTLKSSSVGRGLPFRENMIAEGEG
jgi:hypothetical protein